MKKKYSGIEKKLSRWGWYFVTPSLMFFMLFSFYPIINAAYISLFRKKILSLKAPDFLGLGNYKYLFSSTDFWNSMRATFVFTLGTFIPLVIVSLLLAVLIMGRNKGKKFLQLAYYSPAVLSSVVAATTTGQHPNVSWKYHVLQRGF